MAANFSFPEMTPARIAEALHTYGLAPAVFSAFLATVVDRTWDDDDQQQLGFDALSAIRVLRLHRRVPKLTRMSAAWSSRPRSPSIRRRLRIMSLRRGLEESMVQQLEAEVSSLKQKVLEYNKQELPSRAKSNARNDRKEEILRKISEADFELMKLAQETNLQSKIVQSPEKLKRTLEEKKAAHAELKNTEKISMQNVQEKTTTLEIHSKHMKWRSVSKLKWKNQKLAVFRSEIECKLQCLQHHEKKVEETVAKAAELCLEADSTRISAAEEQQQIYAKFEEIGHAMLI